MITNHYEYHLFYCRLQEYLWSSSVWIAFRSNFWTMLRILTCTLFTAPKWLSDVSTIHFIHHTWLQTALNKYFKLFNYYDIFGHFWNKGRTLIQCYCLDRENTHLGIKNIHYISFHIVYFLSHIHKRVFIVNLNDKAISNSGLSVIHHHDWNQKVSCLLVWNVSKWLKGPHLGFTLFIYNFIKVANSCCY